MNPFSDMNTFRAPDRRHIRWLNQKGVERKVIPNKTSMFLATGTRTNHGYFEENQDGSNWLVFPQKGDAIFWQPKTDQYATWTGHAFALWEHVIWNAGTYAFDHALNIYANPIEWLLNYRDGIVIFDWDRAYYSLRDCPRLSLPECLVETFEQTMKQERLEVFVRPEMREAAE